MSALIHSSFQLDLLTQPFLVKTPSIAGVRAPEVTIDIFDDPTDKPFLFLNLLLAAVENMVQVDVETNA